ncbi:MAG: ferredoxin family protein [Planctomycetota bacterium]|nr:ferredoxin family protein [Planctomycetota bacterium]MDA1214631.1 ferredoxin family protein [Planctomycetota bacterium]
MIATKTGPRVVLYEGADASPLENSFRVELMAKLLERGLPISLARGNALNSTENKQIVLGNFGGRFPEADSSTAEFRDIAGLDAVAVVSLVEDVLAGTNDPSNTKRWKPWFPVIDFGRCTNCMQCLSFCLFDVYGATSDGKIQVQNESNCKTDCPACSRVCPEVAIMFPKYKAGPINGDEISTDDVRREGMKVDISALLGGDIYAMLRDRSAKAQSRFSKERDDERALKERQRCLNKLKAAAGDIEIPTEVLASLPSMDQIQSKAEQARQRAAQALAQQAKSTNADSGQ